MQDGGFLATKRSNPIGMGLVVALHAGVLGAIILTPPEYIPGITIFPPLKIVDIPDPKPPEAVPQKPDEPMKQETAMTRPEVVVPTTIDRTIFPDLRPIDPLPLSREPIKEVIQQPVIVEAALDQRYADAVQPAYPRAMERQGIGGRVTIRVLIGTDGRVKQVEPVTASDPAFEEATVAQALRRWRFTPATRDGVPVESWRTMTVRFEVPA